jgi:hypothetical protein
MTMADHAQHHVRPRRTFPLHQAFGSALLIFTYESARGSLNEGAGTEMLVAYMILTLLVATISALAWQHVAELQFDPKHRMLVRILENVFESILFFTVALLAVAGALFMRAMLPGSIFSPETIVFVTIGILGYSAVGARFQT